MARVSSHWEGLDEAQAKIDELVAAMRHDTPAAVDAVMDRLVRQTKTQLSRGQHAPGTATGSVPPSPPWRISGRLRDSVHKTRARRIRPDRWQGEAGPGADVPDARIQELGGTIRAHNPTGYLWWPEGSVLHRAVSVTLPARPYLKPAWRIVKATVPQVMTARLSDTVHRVLR